MGKTGGAGLAQRPTEEVARPPVRRRSAQGGPRVATVVLVLLVSLFLGTAVGIGAFLLGSHPAGGGTGQPSSSASASSTPAPATLTAVSLHSFDPQGDNTENDDQVSAAVDGDPGTAWYTMRYASARLGGLKQGVGLIADLGATHRVSSVSLTLTAPGASLQLLAGDSPQLTALAPVASVADAGTSVTLTPAQPVDARYLVVWLTSLPPAGDGHGGFKVGVADLQIHGG